MPAASPQEVAAFSEDLTQRTFRYFWETTDTERCLAPDRWPTRSFSSIAATGFALTLVIFSVLSLISYIAMRRFFGLRKGQVKIWDTDINE